MQTTTEYYIATGRKNCLHTLRVCTISRYVCGDGSAREDVQDHHVQNLPVDREAAIAKARTLVPAGATLRTADAGTAAGVGSRRTTEQIQAIVDAYKFTNMVMFGKHAGKSAARLAQESDYCAWLEREGSAVAMFIGRLDEDLPKWALDAIRAKVEAGIQQTPLGAVMADLKAKRESAAASGAQQAQNFLTMCGDKLEDLERNGYAAGSIAGQMRRPKPKRASVPTW